MIQDISPYRYDNAYHPKRPKEEDFLLCYHGKAGALRKQGEEIRFPAFREAQAYWEEKQKNFTKRQSISLLLTGCILSSPGI